MPRKARSEDTTDSAEIESVLTEKEAESSVPRRSRSTATKGRGAFWVSSGSDLMDEIVGGGRGIGYESGMTILFEANSSAGKSFLAHEVVAAAYHKYKSKCKWLYLDCESGCTFDSKQLYGIEVMPSNVAERKRPKTIEDCFSEIMMFGEKVETGELGIVVIDSMDGLMSEEIEERVGERVNLYSRGKELTDNTRGQAKALFLSREFFPSINEMVERKNILCIIVAQYRQAAGQYGPRKTITNGEAIKFYAHARVRFEKKEEIEINGRSIGAVIEVDTVKLKGPRPYRSGFFTLYYSRGIDNVSSNIDYLYDLRTAKEGGLKKGAEDRKLEWEDQLVTRYELIRFIEDTDAEERLSQLVHDKWEREEAEAAKQLEGRKSRYA